MVLRCPKCGLTQMTSAVCKGCGKPLPTAQPIARRTPAPPPASGSDPAFALDRYLFQQRLLTVSEKYDLQDEHGNPVLFVERPAHALRNLAATVAGMMAALALGALIFGLVFQLPKSIQDNTVVVILTFTLGLALPFVVLVLVATALGRKRDTSFYRDQSRQEKLLGIRQDQKFSWFTPTFTVGVLLDTGERR